MANQSKTTAPVLFMTLIVVYFEINARDEFDGKAAIFPRGDNTHAQKAHFPHSELLGCLRSRQ